MKHKHVLIGIGAIALVGLIGSGVQDFIQGKPMFSTILESNEKEGAIAPSVSPETFTESQFAQFQNKLREIDPSGQFLVKAEQRSSLVVVTVSDEWHRQTKQNRLQVAQDLQRLWAGIAAPNAPDTAYVDLVDQNGNDVGGSGVIGGNVSVID